MKKRDLFVNLFLIWLFISPFYYADVLFTGHWQFNIEEAFLHKTIRYVPALFFFIGFSLNRYFSLLAILSGIILCIVPIDILRNGLSSSIFLVNFSLYSGLLFSRSKLKDSDYKIIIKIVAYTSFIVAVLGIFEFFYLSNYLKQYFREDVSRIVSTLFNPNNLAIYLGSGVIAILSLKIKITFKLMILTINAIAIFLTGSRTVWIALTTISLSYALLLLVKFLNGNYKFNRKKIQRNGIIFISTYFIILVIIVFVLPTIDLNSSIKKRVDLLRVGVEFGSLRQRFLHTDFLLRNITAVDILLPSQSPILARFGLVDNNYLTTIQHLGLLFCIAYVTILFLHIRIKAVTKETGRYFMLIIFFYSIVALTHNLFVIFPNNQLFFLACSYFLMPYKLKTPKR